MVVHADWSTDARKRWMARGEWTANGRYRAAAPEPVGDPRTLVDRTRQSTGASKGALLGFDFPIGLPREYATRAGIDDFRAFLVEAGSGTWRDFYSVARQREEISLQRPFYPQRPGNTQQAYLLAGLGVAALDDLRRLCERSYAGRRAACPLFWTLGGQQVGKGAISGWTDVIAPAVRQSAERIALWPFDGPLDVLCGEGRTVLSETYPAEFYAHLGVAFSPSRSGMRSGKRVRSDRAANATALCAWASAAGVELSPELEEQLGDGFGARADGEDRFDAVIGLFGMLNIVLGYRAAGGPPDEPARRVEGWILGQAA
ncbi:MAG: hypothetical protein ABI629_19085 [bacterium]